MDKIKNYLLGILSVVGLFLAYFLNLKSKELEANKAKIGLLINQKEADALESDIKQRLAEEQLNEKDRTELQQALDLIDSKRSQLSDPRTTDKEVIDYWNDKK